MIGSKGNCVELTFLHVSRFGMRVTKIFLKIFASMLISDIGLYFSFMGLSLSGFGIRVMAAS